MPIVQFTGHLRRFFPDLLDGERANGSTVAEVVTDLETRHPGLRDYLVEENGALRKHVNIFVGNTRVRDRDTLSDPLEDDDRVFILQALSGG